MRWFWLIFVLALCLPFALFGRSHIVPHFKGEPFFKGRALSTWIRLFEDKNLDAMQRRSALSAMRMLGRNYPDQIVQPLIEALQDADAEIRKEAAMQLGELHRSAAIPGLIERLDDENTSVRVQAAWSLSHFSSVELAPVLADLFLPVLRQGLNDSSHYVRSSGVAALGQVRPVTASDLQLLAQMLRDPDYGVRYAAAYYLGGMGAEAQPALRALNEARHDPSEIVRAAVAEVIGQIGNAANE